MQAKFQDKLHAEAHHCVCRGDVVADEVTRVAGLDLAVEPVEIVAYVGCQGFHDGVGRVRSSAVDVEGDETVHEEGALGSVHVEKGFGVIWSAGGEEVVKGVVGRDEIPGKRRSEC